jgi:hypothetical protein
VEKSDIQETLVSLYLRLNGYFVSGFIVHASRGVGTEMDVLAVRFPKHQEPEREGQPCRYLAAPTDQIDFLLGEVKGGQRVSSSIRLSVTTLNLFVLCFTVSEHLLIPR